MADLPFFVSAEAGDRLFCYAPTVELSGLADAATLPLVKEAILRIPDFEWVPVVDLRGERQGPVDVICLHPTAKCNFSCPFCYAREAHSSARLDSHTAGAFLDEVLKRLTGRRLVVKIMGGGEPLCEPELVTELVADVAGRISRVGVEGRIVLVTNGSLMSDRIVACCRKFGVTVTLSFEILESLQERRRGAFRSVAQGFDLLLAEGVPVTVRTVIGQDNVYDQVEMIEVLAARHPGARRAWFEPDLSFGRLSVEESREFSNAFVAGYFAAKARAEALGIVLETQLEQSSRMLLNRYCTAELSLGPDGVVTCCHRVSSRADPRCADFAVGEVRGGDVKIDWDLLCTRRVELNAWSASCRDCLARLHCGGDCPWISGKLDAPRRQVRCEMIRSFVRQMRLLELEKALSLRGLSLAVLQSQGWSAWLRRGKLTVCRSEGGIACA